MANKELSCFVVSEFGVPNSMGVYAIMLFSEKTKREKCVYIGSSKNMRNRVMMTSHIYRRLYDRVKKFFVVIRYLECSNYKYEEKYFITICSPFFNKQHKVVY